MCATILIFDRHSFFNLIIKAVYLETTLKIIKIVKTN